MEAVDGTGASPHVGTPTGRYERLRSWTHRVLETTEADEPLSRAIDGYIIALIIVNVITFILSTVAALQARYGTLFYTIEVVSVGIFSVEYLARLWAAPVDPRYTRPVIGRLRYALAPFMVVDLLAILPFFLPLMVGDGRVLRIMRVLRLTRVLKLGRYSRAVQSLGRVVREKREELLVAFAMGFMLLLVVSSVMYFLEHDHQPAAFSSIPATMWWGVTTLTTVGYGDVTPATPMGRLFAAVTQLVGVALFALPAGILASGFSTEMRRRRSEDGRCPTCGTPHEDGVPEGASHPKDHPVPRKS